VKLIKHFYEIFSKNKGYFIKKKKSFDLNGRKNIEKVIITKDKIKIKIIKYIITNKFNFFKNKEKLK
ncbi:hypothetical protein Q0M81_13510, partial [Staphylococcus aureus]|nr:hypothetical protein [Staphylococcus aureus]